MNTSTAPVWRPSGSENGGATTCLPQVSSPQADRKVRIHTRQDSSTSNSLRHVFLVGTQKNTTSAKVDSKASSPLIQAIAEYRNREENWDGYHGKAPSEETIEDAITLIKKFSDQSLPNRVGLSNDGEISLIWEREGFFADFGVIGDKKFTYFIKHNNRKLYGDEISIHEGIPQEALEQLKK